MKAPKSERFLQLRRDHDDVIRQAVEESYEGRQTGDLEREFQVDGQHYVVKTVLQINKPLTQESAPVSSRK